jgi:hypothetical protein
VERIHVVRAPFVNKRKDKIYLGCMTMIVVMYSSVAINSYINHVTELRESDGRCHFGIRGTVSIPFTVVNFFTDMVLTGVFFYLLRPVARTPSIPSLGSTSSKDDHPAHGGTDTQARKDIRTLLWKSIIGSLLIEIPTAANMIQFVITKGEELGMICLMICLIDGTFVLGPLSRPGELTASSVLGCLGHTLAHLQLFRFSFGKRSVDIDSDFQKRLT